jgi:pyruvate dehydrogenase E2 component (dihydrolipoamide acetyltransferase)
MQSINLIAINPQIRRSRPHIVGTLGVGNRIKATISVDHRVSDGAEGAQFMQRFKAMVESPMQLLL